MVESIWRQRLAAMKDKKLKTRAFAAFNTNIDVVVHLTGEMLADIIAGLEKTAANEALLRKLEQPVQSEAELPEVVDDVGAFLRVIRYKVEEGKAHHVVMTATFADWLKQNFRQVFTTMGGQAGIIANQMAALEAASICYTPLLSPAQAELFDSRVKIPKVVKKAGGQALELVPVEKAAEAGDAVKVNWIFEYSKGEIFHFGSLPVETNRANRVILATRPRESVMAFPEEMLPWLGELGSCIDVAFMAGYHYAAPENNGGRDFAGYMAYTLDSLARLTSRNKRLRLHYEYVPMKQYEPLEAAVLRGISPYIHSLGINEIEIVRALQKLGHEAAAEAVKKGEDAYYLYKGAKVLFDDLGMERIHVHNLGYYVVVMRKPYPISWQDAQAASLYASMVCGVKAKYGGYPQVQHLAELAEFPLSEIGFAQLKMFESAVKNELRPLAEGVWEGEDHYVLVIPAHVIPNPLVTVGMGDTISSSSFAMEAALAVDTMTAKC